MKKLLSLLVLIIILCCLISCNIEFSSNKLSGIDSYNVANSSVSICYELLPSDDFLELFSYIDGDYYYVNNAVNFFSTGDEQAIMYLIYEEDIYESAKEFTFQNMYFLENHKYSYNGDEFMVNVCRKMDGRDPNIVNGELDPYWFNMIAFNDEKNTIVFLGFYMPKNLATPEIEQLLTFEDMGAFLKEYFSFYDFDA